MQLKGQTPNALLGLLTFHPMSGYDIRQLIPDSVGHFWNEGYGNIYPALKLLTAKGLVTKKTERKRGRPDRHVYSLTDAGHRQLASWLEVPVEPPALRNELLLKLFFGAHAAPSVSREHVLAYRDDHASAMTVYEATARKLKEKGVDEPQMPFWLMTLSYGHHVCAATIKWCEETLLVLDRMEKAMQVRTSRKGGHRPGLVVPEAKSLRDKPL